MKKVYIFCKNTEKICMLLHTVATRNFFEKHWMECETIERNVPRFKKVKEVVLSSICILDKKTEINLFFEDLKTRSIWILCVSLISFALFSYSNSPVIFHIHPKNMDMEGIQQYIHDFYHKSHECVSMQETR